MLKRLRIAVLLYVLLFVAVGQYLTQRHSRAWDSPLWVDVYPVQGDPGPATRHYIEALEDADFAPLEIFLAEQARPFELGTDTPFRFSVAPRLTGPLPAVPGEGAFLEVLWWSLRMRWLATKLLWTSDRPRPDIVLFAVYHGTDDARGLDKSGALRKGMIVVANVFAGRAAQPTNQVVFAHELLHTVGASDKYDPVSTLPRHPGGFAEPHRDPLFPQARAELMGGRIPLAPDRARIPSTLEEVVVGPATAAEIGWTTAHAD